MVGVPYKVRLGVLDGPRGFVTSYGVRGARSLDSQRLVFVDECDAHVGLVPLQARAPRGERAYGQAPRNRDKNITLLASRTSSDMEPCVAVDGATTKVLFEAYVEQVLASVPRPGQVVVLDNLGAHKGEGVRDLVEERGCGVLFLPFLLSRLLADRGSLLEGQGAAAARVVGLHAGGAGRGDGAGARRGRSTRSRSRTQRDGSLTAAVASLGHLENRCRGQDYPFKCFCRNFSTTS